MTEGKRYRVEGLDSDGTSIMILVETHPGFTLDHATAYVNSKYPNFQWSSYGWREDHQLVIDINYTYPSQEQLESAEFWYNQDQLKKAEEALLLKGE